MKQIVVTGAAGGIGSAVVTRLLAEDYSVWACDKDAQTLKSLPKHPDLKTEAFDVADPKAVDAFGKKLAKQSKDLYALVNNAGIYLGQDLFDYSWDDMERVLHTNLLSAVQLTSLVGQVLLKAKRPGAIVNVSSISAFEGSSDALYGVSKAGLIGLTRSSALTFAPYVRVNAVAPGIVDTKLIKKIPKWRLAEFEKGERLKKRISPEAVAASIFFLLSDESSHTTGSVIDLNNGGYFR